MKNIINKILLVICATLFVALILKQIENNNIEENSKYISKQSKEYTLKINNEEVKNLIYLKEKDKVFYFLLKKEPLSSIDVFMRSAGDFNKFDFKNMDISNLTIQPIIFLNQINDYYLDSEFFSKDGYYPIRILSKIKFKKSDFSENYTNNYEATSKCGASFSYDVAFVLKLSFDDNSKLVIKETERKDYLRGYDTCGFNAAGYDNQ
jgi:hypothetical protein